MELVLFISKLRMFREVVLFKVILLLSGGARTLTQVSGSPDPDSPLLHSFYY